ncbi:uncharacterized protein V6R79_005634 [Siganus canaliculatus]
MAAVFPGLDPSWRLEQLYLNRHMTLWSQITSSNALIGYSLLTTAEPSELSEQEVPAGRNDRSVSSRHDQNLRLPSVISRLNMQNMQFAAVTQPFHSESSPVTSLGTVEAVSQTTHSWRGDSGLDRTVLDQLPLRHRHKLAGILNHTVNELKDFSRASRRLLVLIASLMYVSCHFYTTLLSRGNLSLKKPPKCCRDDEGVHLRQQLLDSVPVQHFGPDWTIYG